MKKKIAIGIAILLAVILLLPIRKPRHPSCATATSQ